MSPAEDPVCAVDFTLVGHVSRYSTQVYLVATYLNLGGWVSSAASGNLIGRAMGSSRDVHDFKCWLRYVAPGLALTQDSHYVDRIHTTTQDLSGFAVMPTE